METLDNSNNVNLESQSQKKEKKKNITSKMLFQKWITI